MPFLFFCFFLGPNDEGRMERRAPPPPPMFSSPTIDLGVEAGVR